MPSIQRSPKKELYGHCIHKKRFQLNHTNNLLSSDEGPIMDPKL